MNILPRHRPTLVACMVCTMAASGLHAQEETSAKAPAKLKLTADDTLSTDSNFLRAPDAKAVSDRIGSQSLTVAAALPYSQQLLEFDANIAHYQHQTLTQFDFTSQNYGAAWHWSLTPSLLGSLRTKHTESLNSTADSVDPNQRNKNTSNVDTLNAAYLLGGPWQLLGEYTRLTSTNEHAVLGTSDTRNHAFTAGVGYTPSAGNSLNYAYRSESGTSTGDYRYSAHMLVATHALSQVTTLRGRLGYVEQRFSANPELDFNGPIGALEATWQATGKTTIAAAWQRELSSFQTQNSTYAQTDTLSLTPTWRISTKLSMALQYTRGVRSSRGSINGLAGNREDQTRDTAWTLQWQPRHYFNLKWSVASSSRTSNVADQNYNAQMTSLGVQFLY